MATFLTGCRSNQDEPDGRLDVVAALFPLAEAVRAVGGPSVNVTDLTPPGVEPHDFELKPSDVERIQDAELVVVIGGGFQPAVERAAERREGPTLAVLRPGEADPHVWLDPAEMKTIAAKIASALSAVRRADAAGYRARAEVFAAEMSELDQAFQDGLASCRVRTLVTAHGAFAHLARRYNLEQAGIAGVDPSAEPSPARIEEIVDLVKAKGITTVFTETLVSPNVADALAREAGVETAVLDPVEGVSDAEAQRGIGYDALMRRNLATLRSALDCTQ